MSSSTFLICVIFDSSAGLSRNFRATLNTNMRRRNTEHGQEFSPDWVSVHHHHDVVQRFGQLWRKLRLLFEWLFPSEVEDIFLRNIVVDYCHAIVITNEGSHPCQEK